MTTSDITVDLRLADKNGSKIKAHADITIALGPDGALKISGFSIFEIEPGKLRVAPPARKGDKRYFDIVMPVGKIRVLIEAAVIADYKGIAGSAAQVEA